MKKNAASILFHCPQCNENFEFDTVGEGEFVPCPVCGTDFFTVKNGNKLTLAHFEQTQTRQEQVILV
jgi:Zn finger protein HypA/HybF involved in hydrogenase expression